jgi:hypothetical protein
VARRRRILLGRRSGTGSVTDDSDQDHREQAADIERRGGNEAVPILQLFVFNITSCASWAMPTA